MYEIKNNSPQDFRMQLQKSNIFLSDLQKLYKNMFYQFSLCDILNYEYF